jgi:hypothetical protein
MDDLRLKRGTNRPVVFEMPADFDTAGKTFDLTVTWQGGRQVFTTSNGLSIASARRVQWSPELAFVQQLPIGRLTTAELQWIVGPIQDSDTGMIEVLPGTTND